MRVHLQGGSGTGCFTATAAAGRAASCVTVVQVPHAPAAAGEAASGQRHQLLSVSHCCANGIDSLVCSDLDCEPCPRQLEGTLPDVLGQLTALRLLTLCGNSLRGTLPAAWGVDGAFTELKVGWNVAQLPMYAATAQRCILLFHRASFAAYSVVAGCRLHCCVAGDITLGPLRAVSGTLLELFAFSWPWDVCAVGSWSTALVHCSGCSGPSGRLTPSAGWLPLPRGSLSNATATDTGSCASGCSGWTCRPTAWAAACRRRGPTRPRCRAWATSTSATTRWAARCRPSGCRRRPSPPS